MDALTKLLTDKKQAGLLRTHHIIPKTSLNFSCNDYLSLSNDQNVKQAYIDGINLYSVSASASPVVGGFGEAHQTFCETASTLFQEEACLVFNSGFSANTAIMALLGKIGAKVLIDKSVHASIYQGIHDHKITYKRFCHQDMNDFEQCFKTFNPDIVITEGVFSMSGLIAPLKTMTDIINGRAMLMVDEAHSYGVLGAKGLGAVEYFKLNHPVIRMVPFGKAMASTGGMLLGPKLWLDSVMQVAKSYIYSTTLSPAHMHALTKILDIIVAAKDKRQNLYQLIQLFRGKVLATGLDWVDSQTQIQSLRIGDISRALQLGDYLKQQDIICFPMRPPTVSMRNTGLRVSLNAGHLRTHLDSLFETLLTV